MHFVHLKEGVVDYHVQRRHLGSHSDYQQVGPLEWSQKKKKIFKVSKHGKYLISVR